jgi:RNA-directed DNA polymerase
MHGPVYVETEEGTPQGGVISPLLCNVALNGLETRVLEAFPPRPRHRGEARPKVHVIRYADDIVVTGGEKDHLIQTDRLVRTFLEERGLTIKEAKTRLIPVTEGFDFLGFNLKRMPRDPLKNRRSPQETVLIVRPALNNIKRIKAKILALTNPGRPLEGILRDLNPVLRGWAEYF